MSDIFFAKSCPLSQTVEYEADEGGFKPRISVEPAASARNGGYDENAADLARSDGPY